MQTAKRIANQIKDLMVELCEGNERPDSRLKACAYTNLEIALMYLERQATMDKQLQIHEIMKGP
jgi:hypothetical protein